MLGTITVDLFTCRGEAEASTDSMYFLGFAESFFQNIKNQVRNRMFGFTALFDTQYTLQPHWLEKWSGLNDVCLWDRIMLPGR